MLSIVEMWEGARNCVKVGGVKAGEQVLLLAEPDTDPVALQAVAACSKEAGAANVAILIRESTVLGQQTPPIIAEAVKAANTLFDFGYPIVHSLAGVVSMMDYGTKHILVEAAAMASEAPRFPPELFYEIGNVARARISGNVDVSVTDSKGTDFRMRIDPRAPGAYIGRIPTKLGPAVPGYIATFPLGTTVWGDLTRTASGVLHLDGAFSFGPLPEPLVIEVEDGVVKSFSGYGADRIRSIIGGIENANMLGEFGFGMNPKVSKDLFALTPNTRAARLLAATRRAGTFFFGMGSTSIMAGGQWSPMIPMYFILMKPTLRIGKETIIDGGHFTVLDDPYIRELAGRFGDPDKLLAEFEV